MLLEDEQIRHCIQQWTAYAQHVGRSTLSRFVAKAREVMMECFVPAHSGLQHISREEVAARNLYIPESLFGNPGTNMEDRKTIIIMD